MSLDTATIGRVYEVEELKLHNLLGRRLEALGLTKGTKIMLLNQKHNGAVILKVRGTRLAVGRKIAQAIVIKETSHEQDKSR